MSNLEDFRTQRKSRFKQFLQQNSNKFKKPILPTIQKAKEPLSIVEALVVKGIDTYVKNYKEKFKNKS
ncbi:hypothetical protein JJC04_00670 [Flavobacterium covae]|nr:hypothetical protein [Flavobacterium covae]QYS91402.1 hypothetical protein JJC04_00670 [Flavobacterium covae]